MSLAKHPPEHPALVLVHGLDGSSESPYMLGIAEMAFEAGFNVLRLNQRNCGGTEHLTPTLQNSGLSTDYRSVLEELITRDALQEVFFTGYSVGGNLVLKMAGGAWSRCAVGASRGVRCQSIRRSGVLLEGQRPGAEFPLRMVFPSRPQKYPGEKGQAVPGTLPCRGYGKGPDHAGMARSGTAPAGGYRNAGEYYQEASALRVAGQIRVPTLIVTAQDDPFIPFESFHHPAVVGNRSITLMAPEHGGHCAFISRNGGRERFWAESRVVEFCAEHSEIVGFGQAH